MRILKTVKEDSCIWIKETIGGVNFLTKWRPYMVGDLPMRFGCIDFQGKEGLNEWFNYKGYTYVRDERY